MLLVPASAWPDYTSTVTGSTGTMTGDAANDVLVIDASGCCLRHSRYDAGDAGFTSGFDFNSSPSASQALPNDAAVGLNLNAGGGDDLIVIGSASLPTSAIAPSVNADGQTEENQVPGDSLEIWNAGDVSGRMIEITASAITGIGGGAVSHAGFEAITMTAGGGADDITLGTGLPDGSNIFFPYSAGTVVQAGGGADRISPADVGGSYPDRGGLNGAAGSDTLDSGAWTTPLAINLAQPASLSALMTPEQEVPANDTDAEGAGTLELDLATNEFDLNAYLFDLDREDVAGSRIRVAPLLQEGPAIFDTGDGSVWTDQTCNVFIACINRTIAGATFPAASVADLLAGNAYLDVETTAFPSGEIRGQFQPSWGKRTEFENVIGGSAADAITGDAERNRLKGGPGADDLSGNGENDNLLGGGGSDELTGGGGSDELTGGNGADKLRGKGKNDTLRADDGQPDSAIKCGGGGGDVAYRDAASIDPDSIVSGCETVNTAP